MWGRLAVLFTAGAFSLSGCLSFPGAQPCETAADCDDRASCDPATGRCESGGQGGVGGQGGIGGIGGPGGAGGGGSSADARPGGGGATGDATPPGDASAGSGGGGAPGDGGPGPDAEVWAQISASGATGEAARSSGYLSRHGAGHTCAVTSESRLFCWGANYDGQLGLGVLDERFATPQEVEPGTRWARVSAGLNHTCGIRAADDPAAPGGLFCWGARDRGRLGLGPSPIDTDRPQRVGEGDDWHEVSAGGGHTCALRGAGILECFGAGDFGQLGREEAGAVNHSPLPVPEVGWTAVAAGLAHTCGIRAGVLACWGFAESGQTGRVGGAQACAIDPSNHSACDPVPRVLLEPAATWVQVAVGNAHTCARTDAGAVWCFGTNYSYELGSQTPCLGDVGEPRGCDFTDVPYRLSENVDDFALGGATTCIRRNGELVCFGDGHFGQRGNGYPDVPDSDDRPAPVSRPASGAWRAVAVGGAHVCALYDAGELACFGSTADGQGGANVFSAELRPREATLPAGVLDVALGDAGGGCAVVAEDQGGLPGETGDVWCWGDATTGLLFDLVDGRSSVPVRLTESADYRQISVGYGFICAVRGPLPDTVVECWGAADRGQLGDGVQGSPPSAPRPVPPGAARPDALQVVAGTVTACEYTPSRDTAVRCWGDNYEGQLGPLASGAGPIAPAVLDASDGARAVALGSTRTFAVAADGHLIGWGGTRDLYLPGQDWDPIELSRPQPMGTASDWQVLAARADLLCGLRGAHAGHLDTLTCGHLPAFDGRPVPVTDEWFTNLTDQVERLWQHVAVGPDTVCASDATGQVFCSGENAGGQLGDGTRENQYFPRLSRVESGTLRFGRLALGHGVACGVAELPGDPRHGGLYCWGHGSRGQLGTGAYDPTVPTPVPLP